jgi:[glutamine synthetase] adenylyltransferase / [glutamine synthetase]-adenylyl-L-tyrosine phosphorylase
MRKPAKRAARKPAPNAKPVGRPENLVRAIHDAPVSTKVGRARLAEWLASIARTPAGKALDRLVDSTPKLSALLAALAEHSPYLWELASEKPARLLAILEAEPAQHLERMLAKAERAVAAAKNESEAMRLLRRAKSKAALLIAVADIGGVWPVMRTTAAVTNVADRTLAAAVKFLLADAIHRSKFKPDDPSRPEHGCGLIVLAMGKMGAHELNYSSDIDLIVLYDPATRALVDKDDAAAFYVRLTRSLIKLMQERTIDGYVFRVDLRLRPDPASTQVAVSLATALDYYGTVGQNWERAALIKARPCAGDIAAGEQFLREVSPFVWRKYLDFAAVADIEAMKRQIHAYRGHDEIAVEGHNIKLGRGGIREIEFFVQTQQLIAGGRHPELRKRGTLEMLDALVQSGWIDGRARDELGAAYRFLRVIEHRLQMVADEQTHTLPSDPQALDRFAKFAGFDSRDTFAEALLGHLRKVQHHYAGLFEDAARSAQRPTLSFPKDSDNRETLDWLAEHGFQKPLEASAIVRHWYTGKYAALKGLSARQALGEFLPMLFEQLVRLENSDAALVAFDRFLEGLQGGGRLFSSLKKNPDLVALVVRILGVAPRLAEILARYPQAIDALLDPAFFGALPDEGKLSAALSRYLDEARTYEEFLDQIRMFGQEQMFLIGARILSGTVSAEQAGEAFARPADVVIRALHRKVEDDFIAQHGRLRNQQIALLALGKLGGREMTAASDLDLIIVYDFNPEQEKSDGAKPLFGSQYFARLTQRLISALTSRTNYGALYQVDMRLRPSGRSGPVATSIDAFKSYQDSEAWTWEHMALTRARVVSASSGFEARVEKVIHTVLCREREPETVVADVVEMRSAIAREKGEGMRWDLKYVHGGLVDIEFIAQYLQLVHAAKLPDILDTSSARVLDKAAQLGVLKAEDADVLRPAARLYHDLTQILRLCLSGPFDPKSAGQGLLGLLARAADLPDFATLDAHVAETQTRVRKIFTKLLGEVA